MLCNTVKHSPQVTSGMVHLTLLSCFLSLLARYHLPLYIHEIHRTQFLSFFLLTYLLQGGLAVVLEKTMLFMLSGLLVCVGSAIKGLAAAVPDKAGGSSTSDSDWAASGSVYICQNLYLLVLS